MLQMRWWKLKSWNILEERKYALSSCVDGKIHAVRVVIAQN